MQKTILGRMMLIAAASLVAASHAGAQGNFFDGLDSQSSLFTKSDGWTNGAPFNAGWRADHINFSGGYMNLTLDNATCPSGCSNAPYASGEYRTVAKYGYGRIEARFKAAKASGIVAASLFTYTGPTPWDEIDIEILGKDTTKMQTNYYTNGVGGKEVLVNLGFDASAGFHTYAFEWTSTAIRWYVDGVLVNTETGSKGPLPTNSGQIMANFWPGTGVDSWLGPFSYAGALQAQYDYISFTTLTPTPTPTATATARPTATATARPTATSTATSRATSRATATATVRATATATARATATATARATATATARATATSGAPAWAPGVSYAVGQLVTYNSVVYHALQAHTSQVGWEPPNAQSLWAVN